MDDAHIQQNQDSFTQQATTFEDTRFNRVLTADSDWVFDRPGGSVVIADLVADGDRGVAERQNALERLRDPSHARAFSSGELVAALVRHGLEVVGVEQRDVRRPLSPWMEQTKTPRDAAAEIERALTAELDGGPTTGFQPQRGAVGELTIVQTLRSLVARSPQQ